MKLINDLSIRLVKCEAEDQKFVMEFIAFDQSAMQVMCYLISLLLAGKNTTFGPLDAKSIMEEFQEDYYKTLNDFPTINQWDMIYSIEVDYKNKKQKHVCKFRHKMTENMDVELLCVQSDHGGMRIDFYAPDEENLKNGCYFIYMVLRGKGANQGEAYVNTIFEQFTDTFIKQKAQDVRIQHKDVSWCYAVMYENGDQKFICYMN